MSDTDRTDAGVDGNAVGRTDGPGASPGDGPADTGDDATVLQTRNLIKKYGSLVAVDDVTVGIRKDEITSIVGPNGAGKTTFVNMIGGRIEPTEGEVSFNGENLAEIPEHERAQRGLVKSFQEPQIYGDLTAIEHMYAGLITRDGDNYNFVRSLSADENLREQAIELLVDFGLDEYRTTAGENLPYGGRKILDIAMSFATDPDLLLMDEPTSGVATGDSTTLMDTVTDAITGIDTGLVFIEHDMELVRDYSDRVIVLYQGEILADGPPDEVLESDTVREYFYGG
jgi:branched-chain amino acid transport system ATP-binding protein